MDTSEVWLRDNPEFTRSLIRRQARRLLRQTGMPATDLDDVEQHLTFELWKSSRSFNSARGTWQGFATAAVKQAGIKILRDRRAQKRDDRGITSLIVTHNCFYGWKAGAAHKYYGPNNATDLWHVKKIPPQQLEHLTGKPAELAVRAMQYSSVAGENVLDLFGGSGSTLIGAEQCGRNAFLMELDQLYSDVIVDRYQRFSGKPAVLERTGDSPIPMKAREESMR